MYDSNILMNHIGSLMCSDRCREEWQIKYTKKILGQDGESPVIVTKDSLPEEGETKRYREAESCLCNGVGCNSCEPQGRG